MARLNVNADQSVSIIKTPAGKAQGFSIQNVGAADVYYSENQSAIDAVNAASPGTPPVGHYLPGGVATIYVYPRFVGQLFARTVAPGQGVIELITHDVEPDSWWCGVKSFFGRAAAIILILMVLATPAKGQVTIVGKEATVTYAGQIATLATNVPATAFVPTTGTNTFIMTASPQVAARIYITNTSANTCNGAFQVAVATTANQSDSSLAASVQDWNYVPVINPNTGAFAATSGTLNLAAGATYIVTTSAIAGKSVAIQIENTTSSCSTTTLTILVIYTQVSIEVPLLTVASNGTVIPVSGAEDVQGVIPPGQSASGVNPLICGFETSNGTVSQACVGSTPGLEGSSTFQPGLFIGDANQTLNGYSQSKGTTPNGATGGPMISAPTARNGSTGQNSFSTLAQTNGVGQTNTTCPGSPNGNGCPGLLISDTGFQWEIVGATVANSGTLQIGEVDSALGSEFQTCRFDFIVTSTTGGPGTIDAYIQDSIDGANWNDRVHFAQISGNTAQYASVSGNGYAPTATASYSALALGASTIAPGALATHLRWAFVATGGLVGVATLAANCK